MDSAIAFKARVIERLIQKVEQELGPLLQAAESAREAATHEESRAEDQHDTRGLEASYLAGAQAGRALELKGVISQLRMLGLRDFKAGEGIDIGALIELAQSNGRRAHYFFLPVGGGLSVSVGGQTILVITPKAPLAEELLGKRAGSSVEIEAQGKTREYEIIQVR